MRRLREDLKLLTAFLDALEELGRGLVFGRENRRTAKEDFRDLPRYLDAKGRINCSIGAS